MVSKLRIIWKQTVDSGDAGLCSALRSTRWWLSAGAAVISQLAGGFDSFVTPMETAKLTVGLRALGLSSLNLWDLGEERTLTLLLAGAALLCLLGGALLCEVRVQLIGHARNNM